MRKVYIQEAKKIVVKIGTSILTRHHLFDKTVIERLAGEVSAFLKKGTQVSIVSSGAIGAGMMILKERSRPKSMQALQAAAAAGQRYLMQCYEEAFSKRGFSTAQILLTWEDLAHRRRFVNAKHTLREIQHRGLVPIINENDTVATDEIRFGDNDRLSALLSILIEADTLVILSDTNGLYEKSRAERIPIVEKMNDGVFSHVRDRKKSFTVGGMRSKLEAARVATRSGIPVFLADGRDERILERLFKGEDLGTLFLPHVSRGHRGRSWIFHFLREVRR